MSKVSLEQSRKSIDQIRQNRFRDPVVLVASGFGIGWIAPAPGTVASLIVAGGYWWFVSPTSVAIQIATIAFVCLFALITLQVLVRKYGYVDARQIVIDEIAGVTIALSLLPEVLWVCILAFVLFRLFDIWKPFPIGWIDKTMKSGMGILLDDLMAGGMACVIATAAWIITVET
ncbi:MAG: phosphatidylglycerophosphatase A [Gammaproteobacteria bacterium]|nr:phosphatidylglycerophosphatase A [Gammaproteobacteria bacterium]